MTYKIADLHSDILSCDLSDRQLGRFCKADIICAAVFTKNGDCNINQQISKFADIKCRSNFLLCFENLHFIEKIDFEYFLSLNPFYAGLTWNGDNCLSHFDGLTKYGLDIVKKLQKNNILIDTAHLNKNSFYDLINVTNAPIINSHTCLYSMQNHERNIDDEQVKLIIQSGGVIGLTFVKQFLSDEKNCGISDIVRHIDYFCDKFDYRRLCLGSDYAGSINIPAKIKNYRMWANLVGKLSKIGYNKNIIEKILYYNFHDFMNRQRRDIHG